MDNSDIAEKSVKATVITFLMLMALLAASILVISAPLSRLMGESPYRLQAAFHGLFAGIFLVTSTVGFYQALRLWRGSSMHLADLEIGSVMNAVFCFFTIALGNWIYIPYRVSGGPRSYFLETASEVHKIFFEFKEFTALFTLPLSVAAAFIICRYGGKLLSNRPLREMTALLLVLNFFYFVVVFGLGAAITKLKSV